jgi:sarcosine oxidase subunit alpha
LHDWHAAHGAVFTDIGAWKRAAYYLQADLTKDDAIEAEMLAVRNAVGMIDGSSLGKIEIHGSDAAEFLERFFTGKYANQKIGTWRYALMLDEAGVVVDDGVACRVAQDLFYLSIGTTNAAMVYREMQRWQQMWQLNIVLVNVTGAFGAINLAGPFAQRTLAELTDCDLSLDSFPLGHVREALVANIPSKIIRASFVSDMAYEIHSPMNQIIEVWAALLKAGMQYGIRPFGSDTQRLLRLEMGHAMPGVDTDGLTNPYEMGADWAVKMDKPYFVGQRSLVIINKRPMNKHLVAFTLENDKKTEIPLECNLVIEGDSINGRVTSIGFSQTLDKTIGLAYVKPHQKTLGTTFQIRTDSGSLVSAKVVDTPFIKNHKEA